MENPDEPQKISNFPLHRFSWYSTPNMALQKIILTSFFLLLPDQGLRIFCAITSRRYWAIGTKFCRYAQGWMLLYLTLFGFNRSRGFRVGGLQSEQIFWNFPHAFSGSVSNIEIFTKIYIYRIRTAGKNSTRNSLLEAHFQGLAGKWVKLGFSRAPWPCEGQILVFREINQHFDSKYNTMETFLNK